MTLTAVRDVRSSAVDRTSSVCWASASAGVSVRTPRTHCSTAATTTPSAHTPRRSAGSTTAATATASPTYGSQMQLSRKTHAQSCLYMYSTFASMYIHVGCVWTPGSVVAFTGNHQTMFLVGDIGTCTCAYFWCLQLEIMHAVLNQHDLSRDKSFFYFRAPISSSDDPSQLKVSAMARLFFHNC